MSRLIGHLHPNYEQVKKSFKTSEYPSDRQLLRNLHAAQTAEAILAGMPGYELARRALISDITQMVCVCDARRLTLEQYEQAAKGMFNE